MAASSANQSSDLRQKIRKPTPYQTAAVITEKMMLATQNPTLGITSTNHTVRAMISQEPVKRVFATLATTEPLALFSSISDRFMHRSLTRSASLLLVCICEN